MRGGFSIRGYNSHGRQVIVPDGELDMSTVPDLMQRASQLLAHEPRALVIDLRELTFMDSTGLRAVLELRERCQEQGCEFALVHGHRGVRRLFEITDLLDAFQFSEDIDEDGAASGGADGLPAADGDQLKPLPEPPASTPS